MEAVVIEKPFHGVEIKLRLWTGEVLHVDRAFVPLSGPLNIGDRLDVQLKEFKWIMAARSLQKHSVASER